MFFVHAFWMALSTFIVALFFGFGSRALLLSYFIAILYFTALFSPLFFYLFIFLHLPSDPWHFLISVYKCQWIQIFPLMLLFIFSSLWTHTNIQKYYFSLLPFLLVCSPPFLHSSILPKDKRRGGFHVWWSVWRREVDAGRPWTAICSVAMNSTLYPY